MALPRNRGTEANPRTSPNPGFVKTAGTDLAQTKRLGVKKQQGQNPGTPIAVPKGATILKVENIGQEVVEIVLNSGPGDGWLLDPNEREEFRISDKVVFRAIAPSADSSIQYAFG